MLINIIGYTINTEQIYCITPIKGNNCWSHMPSNATDAKLTHSAYSFEICFLNGKTQESLKILLDGDKVFPIKPQYKWNDWYSNITQEEYDTKLKIIFDKVNTVRNQVILYWNKSRSALPNIEF